jgi:WD40 repeat protein
MQLAAGTGNEIILWSLENGEKQRTFLGHEKPISNEGLAFSFNGEKLASVSYDNTARLWDVKTGKNLRTFEESFQNTIAFSPDDKLLAINSDENIHLWDIASGKLLHTLREHQNEVMGLSFVADGRYVVSAGYDRLIRIWDAKSEDVTVRVLQGHKAVITGITTYKRQLFTASNDGTVQRWETNLPSQKIVDLSGHPESVAINPNGNNIAVGFKDGTLRLYSHPETYLLTKYEKAHTNAIIHIAFNVSGNLLASASVDNTAKLWKIKRKLGKISLQEKISFKHKDIVQAVAFSPDNQTLATASHDGQIGLLTLNTNQKRFFQAHEKCDKYGCVKSVAFNNSGTHLLSSGYNERVTRLWNLNTEPPTLSRTFPEALDKLLWASISPDNQKIASVGDDLLVHIYTNQNDQEQYFSLVGHENPITRVIFSPDSQQVATISLDTTIRLWDLKSRRELFILYLPMTPADTGPWDFDFLCLSNKHCWIAVPLTTKKSLKLYDLGKYE